MCFEFNLPILSYCQSIVTLLLCSQETEAKALFRTGIEYEREGNYYEATRSYKRALKLDAGVEKKIAEEEAALRSMDTCKNILGLLKYLWTLTFSHYYLL